MHLSKWILIDWLIIRYNTIKNLSLSVNDVVLVTFRCRKSIDFLSQVHVHVYEMFCVVFAQSAPFVRISSWVQNSSTPRFPTMFTPAHDRSTSSLSGVQSAPSSLNHPQPPPWGASTSGVSLLSELGISAAVTRPIKALSRRWNSGPAAHD